MLPSWARDEITVTEPTWVDERGSKVPVYSGAGTVITGCSVQAGTSVKDLVLRENITVRFTAFLPETAVVSPYARITFEGVDYALEGAPARWRSPFGRASHVMLLLVDWVG